MSAELCYLGATEALELFRARKLSPVELIDAVIARAGQVEDRKSTRLNSSHLKLSRMPSSA